MNTNNYLIRVKDEHWEDIQRVKTLDNCSANSIINEGIRLVVKKKMEELSTLRKNRTSLQNMVSAWLYGIGIYIFKKDYGINLLFINWILFIHQ